MEKQFGEQLHKLRQAAIYRLVELIPFYGEPSEFFPADNVLKCGTTEGKNSTYIEGDVWVAEILYNNLVGTDGQLYYFDRLNAAQLLHLADHFDKIDVEFKKELSQ